MIAIDTNVLLRYLLSDHSEQSPKAARLIRGNHQVLITDAVLVETVWTLKGKKYNLDRPAIARTLNALFAESNIRFEDDQVVWRALNDYINAPPIKVGSKRKTADFADALIVNKAVHIAKTSDSILRGVYTFDQAAQKIPGTKQP